MIGLVIVARFICQASVEADQSGPNTDIAEFAIGFHSVKTELWANARQQNILSKTKDLYDPVFPGLIAICSRLS